MSDSKEMKPEPAGSIALLRGLARRCPVCGAGRLFSGYLKRADACARCGQSFAGLDADDGPAWMTIGATTFLTVPLVIALERAGTLSTEVEMVALAAFVIVTALIVLPFAKGFFIGALWALGRRGE